MILTSIGRLVVVSIVGGMAAQVIATTIYQAIW